MEEKTKRKMISPDAEHLVQLGKQFDMQVYTNRNHGIYGGNTRNHLYTRLTNFFLNNL